MSDAEKNIMLSLIVSKITPLQNLPSKIDEMAVEIQELKRMIRGLKNGK